MKNFDVGKNIVTLLPEWVSRANAKQRSGRAGRSLSLSLYMSNFNRVMLIILKFSLFF